jgi:macrolide transport system ATP-binding/permease protein
VRIGRSQNGDGSFRSSLPEEYAYLREHASSFSGLTGQQIHAVALQEPGGSRIISAEIVTSSYFAVLGVPIAVGRGFLPADDQSAVNQPVAVISERFWKRQFGGDPAAIGRIISVNVRLVTIVGIAPRGFLGTFPGVDVDLWVPLSTGAALAPSDRQSAPPLMLLGRLKPHVQVPQAEAELQTLNAQMNAVLPGRGQGRGFVVGPARGAHPLVARIARVLLAGMMAISGLVLLIACANVAGLMLARAAARRSELAVRLAIGAGRARLVRQLLVESVLLAGLGGTAGTFLAFVAIQLLNGYALTTGPTGAPIALDLRLDARVLGFTSVVSLLTAVVFGLVPALRATRADVLSTLKDSQATWGSRPSRVQCGLVIVQVVASCVLLVGATLLLRSVHKSATLDLGFNPNRVVVSSFEPAMLGYSRAKVDAFYDALLTRTRAWPGVEAAAVADFVPMGARGNTVSVRLPASSTGASPVSSFPYNRVSDGYFTTIDQPLLRGRDFSARDSSSASPVVIVNEALARRFWPDSSPIGKTVRLDGESVDREVVGVARDAKFASFGDNAGPFIYLPVGQRYGPNLTLHIRTNGSSSEALAAVRQIAADVDPNVPATEAQTMRERMAFALVPARLGRSLLAIAGFIALLLASCGLFGLIGYTLERRQKEIGIRIALGATRVAVLRAIAGRTLRLAGVGVAIGLILALLGARFLRSLLYGLSPFDPVAFAGVACLMLGVTAGASYAAARRGLDVDPIVVLRRE